MSHNFIIPIVDTDSLTVSKKDGSEFCKNELEALTEELNSLFPPGIKWEFEFYIPKIIVLKSKNYILYDGKKIKTKGSSLRDQKREPALKAFLNEIIESIVFNRNDFSEIYNKYVSQIFNIKDIKPWASKKSYTEKLDTSERLNETKIKDTLEGSEYKPGDRFYVFFKEDESLCLVENFNGDYSIDRLLEKLYKTSQIFANVLPTKDIFLNYSLKKNRKKIDMLFFWGYM